MDAVTVPSGGADVDDAPTATVTAISRDGAAAATAEVLPGGDGLAANREAVAPPAPAQTDGSVPPAASNAYPAAGSAPGDNSSVPAPVPIPRSAPMIPVSAAAPQQEPVQQQTQQQLQQPVQGGGNSGGGNDKPAGESDPGAAAPAAATASAAAYSNPLSVAAVVNGRTVYIAPSVMYSNSNIVRPVWHDMEAHRPQRKLMISTLMNLLAEGMPGNLEPSVATAGCHQLALSNERAMYYGARSFAEYTDQSTLRDRILALIPFEYSSQSGGGGGGQQQLVGRALQPSASSAFGPHTGQALVAASTNNSNSYYGGGSGAANGALNPALTAAAAGSGSGGPSRNSSAAGSTAAAAATPPIVLDSKQVQNLAMMLTEALAKNKDAVAVAVAGGAGGGSALAQQQQHGHSGGAPSSSAAAPRQYAAGGAPPPPQQQQPSSDAHIKRQQSIRLQHIFHAAKCTTPNGECGVDNCMYFRTLWPHMQTCGTEGCTQRHCVSSRYCLNHFRSCADPNCVVCVPVRSFLRQQKEQLQREQQQQHGGGDAAADGGGGAATSGMKRSGSSAGLYRGTGADGAAAATAGGGGDNKRSRVDDGGAYAQQQQGQGQSQQQQLVHGIPRSAWDAMSEAERSAAFARQQQRGASAGSAAGVGGAAAADPSKPKRGKIDGDSTLIATFNKSQIMSHLNSLQFDFNAGITPDVIRGWVDRILESLMAQQFSWIFNSPVDPVKLGLPDYFDVIKRPMDLGTIRKRLDTNYYRTFRSFHDDVELVFKNALRYNPPDSQVHYIARQMQDYFDKYFETYIERPLKTEFEKATQDSENSCNLCGGGEFPYEPPTLYCNQCSARLKRSVSYYSNRSNKYHLCAPCHGNMRKANSEVFFDGQNIRASDLIKLENRAEDVEGWVMCDFCRKWQHMVCALYNPRRNETMDIPHYCARCILGHMTARNTEKPISNPVRRAHDLKRCHLSDVLESRLANMMETRRDVLSVEQDCAPENVIMPVFTVRVVTCSEKYLLATPEFYERYKGVGYPSQFNYRSKALVLWQNIGNVDVLIYGVYVQEYGDDCAPPNRRCAYLSYLDSVKYLEPQALRTDVYHEILVAYLEDIKARGFNQLGLWSCPPLKGDDYIFYCHPEDQKTPKADRLREWYLSMLDTALRRGIAERVVYLADDYFPSLIGKEGGADRTITQLPMCEGDYWPGVAETFAKALREGTMTPATFAINPPPQLEQLLGAAAAPPAGGVAAATVAAAADPLVSALAISSTNTSAATSLLSAAPAGVGAGGPAGGALAPSGTTSTLTTSAAGAATAGAPPVAPGLLPGSGAPLTFERLAALTPPVEAVAYHYGGGAAAAAAAAAATAGGDGGDEEADGQADGTLPPYAPDGGGAGGAVGSSKGGPGAKGSKGKGGRGRGSGRGGPGSRGGRGGKAARGRKAPPGGGGAGAGGAGGAAASKLVLGTDALPIAYDPLRDRMAEMLMAMQKDFIIVKLRPACQWCKRYITGAPGMECKYRCIECAKVDAPQLCPPMPTQALSTAGRAAAAAAAAANAGGSTGSGVKVTFDLCPECYERERTAALSSALSAVAALSAPSTLLPSSSSPFAGTAERAGGGAPLSASSSTTAASAGGSAPPRRPLALLVHEHPITSFKPIAVERAPGLQRVVMRSNGAQQQQSMSASSSFASLPTISSSSSSAAAPAPDSVSVLSSAGAGAAPSSVAAVVSQSNRNSGVGNSGGGSGDVPPTASSSSSRFSDASAAAVTNATTASSTLNAGSSSSSSSLNPGGCASRAPHQSRFTDAPPPPPGADSAPIKVEVGVPAAAAASGGAAQMSEAAAASASASSMMHVDSDGPSAVPAAVAASAAASSTAALNSAAGASDSVLSLSSSPANALAAPIGDAEMTAGEQQQPPKSATADSSSAAVGIGAAGGNDMFALDDREKASLAASHDGAPSSSAAAAAVAGDYPSASPLPGADSSSAAAPVAAAAAAAPPAGLLSGSALSAPVPSTSSTALTLSGAAASSAAKLPSQQQQQQAYSSTSTSLVLAPRGGSSTAMDTSSAAPSSSSALVAVAHAQAVALARQRDLEREGGLLVDPDPLIESPFWVTRQAFLNLCQGNHYQFDQLRRAKHSSMMILWHMHHPHAPAFVHSCNACGISITSGHRWTCNCCDEFDLCDACKAGAAGDAHEHKLFCYPVVGNGEGSAQEEDMLKAYTQGRSQIANKISLLSHATLCRGCASSNCRKMKEIMSHSADCATNKQRGGCTVCTRTTTITLMHAKQCRLQSHECPIPRCAELKEQMRRGGTAQSAMDARRRAATTAAGTAGPAVPGAATGDEPAAAAAGAGAEGAPGAAAVGAAAGPGVPGPSFAGGKGSGGGTATASTAAQQQQPSGGLGMLMPMPSPGGGGSSSGGSILPMGASQLQNQQNQNQQQQQHFGMKGPRGPDGGSSSSGGGGAAGLQQQPRVPPPMPGVGGNASSPSVGAQQLQLQRPPPPAEFADNTRKLQLAVSTMLATYPSARTAWESLLSAWKTKVESAYRERQARDGGAGSGSSSAATEPMPAVIEYEYTYQAFREFQKKLAQLAAVAAQPGAGGPPPPPDEGDAAAALGPQTSEPSFEGAASAPTAPPSSSGK